MTVSESAHLGYRILALSPVLKVKVFALTFMSLAIASNDMLVAAGVDPDSNQSIRRTLPAN